MGARTHGVWANNGGADAPLTPRGRIIFRATIGFVLIAGVAAIVWTRLL